MKCYVSTRSSFECYEKINIDTDSFSKYYYEIGSDCYYFEIIKDWNNKK